jgi:predicted ATPase
VVAGDFADGVWMVELAPVSDPDSVPATVAAALGVGPQAGMTVLGSVLEWLQGRRLLLVLDNCEHLLAAVVAVTSAILGDGEAVTVLATSREPLGFAGERVVPVPALEGEDAVGLFCDRAAAFDASVAFRADDRAIIGAICARLDGVPLAIELAAARWRSLGPAELLARLDDRFRLLRGGGRGGLERHQTLRATVSWSYQLLDATQRALFDRLAVFAGGFDLPAAEAVCGFAPLDELDIVDVLGALVDKSLVVADHADRVTRFRLLETLRQYGEERLEERGEMLVAQERHLVHYLAVARRWYHVWLTERYPEAAAVFSREWDNLRAAHATALAIADLERAEAILDATYAPALHDQRAEYLEWAQLTLAAAEAAGRHRAATYGQAASFLFRLGDYDQAIETATAGLETPSREARGALLCLTYIHAALGREQPLSKQRQTAATGLDELFSADGDPFVTAVAITTVAAAGAEAVRDHLDRLDGLAADTSAPPLQELAALSRGVFFLGHDPPDLQGALAAFRRGAELAGQTAGGPIAAANLYGVATCSVRLQLPTADDACREAIQHCYEARHWSVVWGSVQAAMVELAAAGELEAATVIYGHLEAHSPGMPTFGVQAGNIDRRLGGPNMDRWRAQGAAMDRHELVRYALGHLGPPSQR